MGAVLEQLERIEGVGVLGQHHDTHAGMLGANPPGGGDAFGLVIGRHSDVHDRGVGVEALDSVMECFGVSNGRHDLHHARRLQQLAGSLSKEVVVLCDHDSDSLGHGVLDGIAGVGSCAATTVPRLGFPETVSSPPSARIRSVSPTIPEPMAAVSGSKPTPLSLTSRRTKAPSRSRATSTKDASECFRALLRASAVKK